jgi:UDP-3-O-[3-hydroxymyristoyl] glucosamine N-acyltransferase
VVVFGHPSVRLGDLARQHGGSVDAGAETRLVERIAPLDDAVGNAGEGEGDLSPLTARRHLQSALTSRAALLVDAELAPLVPAGRRWVHPHAAWALAGILSEIESAGERARSETPLFDPSARIDPRAEIAPGVRVGPGAVIMEGVSIGPQSIIEPHAVIYPRVRLGARVLVGAGAIVGRPGFGWAVGPDASVRRIPQLGGVWVGDDVEIGALATVDAGTLAATILGAGVRIDAHVHVGHNVELGESTMVAAQSGFAGSVKIGAGVRVGGQAGVADHVQVGDGARIAAKAGVIGDVPARDVVAGYPAVGRARWLRGVARMLSLGGKRGSRSHS